MSVQNQKNLIKKLVSLIGVASTSILFSSPALALINSSSFNKSFNNNTLHADSTGKSRQLVAQTNSSPGAGGVNPNGTGAGGVNPNGTGAGGVNPNGTGAGGVNPNGTGAGGVNPNGTGAGGVNPSGTGAGGVNPSGTGAGGVNPSGTGAGGVNPSGTGAGGSGRSTNGGQSTNRSRSGNGRSNGSQRTVYTQYMRAGYAATQQKDYQTALTNFKKALSIRPNDSYATKAIQNVQSYIQRSQGNR